jgi:hypothetical protein
MNGSSDYEVVDVTGAFQFDANANAGKARRDAVQLQARNEIAGAEGIMRKAAAVAVELQEKGRFWR